MDNTSKVTLSQEVTNQIDKWLTKFPVDKKISCLIPALTIVQKDNSGYLTNDLIIAVAKYLGVPDIAAFEVATFYSMFEHKPKGRHKICICTNVSCMLKKVDSIVDHLKDKLQINFGETTTDGRFSLKEVECLGACGGAPAIQIGDDYYEDVTVEKIDAILEKLE